MQTKTEFLDADFSSEQAAVMHKMSAELGEVINRFREGGMPPCILLAVISHILGQTIGMLETFDLDDMMELVKANIELGAQLMVEHIDANSGPVGHA